MEGSAAETVPDRAAGAGLHDRFRELRDELSTQVIGQAELVERLLIALLADGHLLVEGAPGLAKTTAVKALATRIEANFQRVQFTPDLLPSDLTGTDIWRQTDGRFEFQPGPLFHNLLLADETLLGYFVAMMGVDEVHLLNITVAPAYQRQGWARVMLDALRIWARGQGAQWLWLEARVGNTRALQVYESHGFRHIGRRKAYYPSGDHTREDAIVMNLPL